ncbi:MAG: SixA phosphatase family protein [Trebonia sp.]
MAAQERRTLLLLRHAKSAWPDVPDHERPLARRGQRDARIIGHWLRAVSYIPDQVACSTARRAAQTWRVAQPALGPAPPAVFDDRVYEADAVQLLEMIRRTPEPVRTLLVVGHDPALPGLALTLAAAAPGSVAGTGNQAVLAAADRMRAKFPTAAVAAFVFRGEWDQLAPGLARLACFVTPGELRTAADPGGKSRRSGSERSEKAGRHLRHGHR